MAMTQQHLQLHDKEFPPHYHPHLTTEDNSHHHYHLLRQIREDKISDDGENDIVSVSSEDDTDEETKTKNDPTYFQPYYTSTKLIYVLCRKVLHHPDDIFCHATWIGFWALLIVTCANYVLAPMRDAVALQVGVENIPKLTLASSCLAFLSSVPIGWLFEAPDPNRRKLWKKMGLTRGETQGTSLALFYRCFALIVLSYAVGFSMVDFLQKHPGILPWNNMTTTTMIQGGGGGEVEGRLLQQQQQQQHQDSCLASEQCVLGTQPTDTKTATATSLVFLFLWNWIPFLINQLGHVLYIAFFLVIHLMKLHSLSLVWGVTTEAMEYEDVARKAMEQKSHQTLKKFPKNPKTRLQMLLCHGHGYRCHACSSCCRCCCC